jgi:phosphatidylglycerophosphate synthase
MLSYKKSSVEKYFEPLVKHLSTVNPNILTLLGSIPSLLFFVFLVWHWYLLAIIAFFGNFFDFIDGMVARKYHKVTAFGGFLDSTLDRVADFFLITAFAFGDIVRWNIVAPLLLCSFLISYIRGTSEKLALNNHDTTTKFNVGLIERSERLALILLAVILFSLFPDFELVTLNSAEIIFALLTILSAYTVYQRMMYAYKKL